MQHKMDLPKQCLHNSGQNLSHVDRAAAARSRTFIRNAIWEDVQDYWRQQEERAQELAVKHNKGVNWIRHQLSRSAGYGTSQKINKYNAWLHAQSLVVNEGEFSGFDSDSSNSICRPPSL